MLLRRHLVLLVALIPGIALAQSTAPAPAATPATLPAASAPPAPTLTVVTDRAPALYGVGDRVTFAIRSSDAKLESVSAVLSKDGWKAQPTQTVALTGGVGSLTVTLTEPGITQLRVSASNPSGSVLAAAACDPEKLAPSLPVPEDFDAFWAAQKAALAKVPLKFSLTPTTTQAQNVAAFDAQIDCLGPPVSGYFGRPKNAQPKSCPAILFLHGAGVRGANLGATFWAEREGGMLALDINAHGLPNGKPEAFYEELNQGALKDYRFQGRADRETNYFKGMFLRIIRAIDFLTTQPEWDGKTVIAYGSSQGGFQAFAAGALDPRVTFLCAGVPAGCDHSGMVVDRISGWPKLVSLTEGVPNEAELQTARYFDCVNFAQRCHAKGAAVTVGLIDTTCPPTGIYAAYNALPIPKSIHADPLSGHRSTPEAAQFLLEAAQSHIRTMQAAP
jgi:cephalosporin-C deacetylase-like acetyl esterase